MNELLKQNFSDTKINRTPEQAGSGLLGDICIKQTGSSRQQLELGNPWAAMPAPCTDVTRGGAASDWPSAEVRATLHPSGKRRRSRGAGRREQKVASSAPAGLGFWQLTLRAV